MAHYLVSAAPKAAKLDELRERLARNEFVGMQPFGRALTMSLRGARLRGDGMAVWEEEDYCRPPLAQERAAVLDTYFDDLEVQPVPDQRPAAPICRITGRAVAHHRPAALVTRIPSESD
jgi:hypothetical protein